MAIALEGMEEIIREFLVESAEGLDLLDRDLVALEREPTSHVLLAEIFRAVHTIKGTSGVLGFPVLESVAHVGENLLSRLRDGKMMFSPAIASGLLAMVDALRSLLRNIEQHGKEGDGDFSAVVRQLESLLEAPTAAAPATAIEPAPQAMTTEAAATASPPAPVATERATAVDSPGVSSSNIRVDVGLLDKMMNLVGELVLARNQILQCSSSQIDAAFANAAQRLNLITTELQEGVMKTRMQPIGNIWGRFPRLVRDLALQCGKQVTIEMEGSNTELDKTIIEAIKDPLTHILRNSIDHGIELPAERQRAGKAPEGHIHLRAYHESGQVNIEVSDDGAGISLERVQQRALQRGLITPEQAARMSERELANLVFLPGFSTAEKVSNVSGRGVGMDVVKTNIEKIGGAVDLQSVAGCGTTLRIKIPLTLAIIPALVVTSGGDRFAIPQVSLLELVRLPNTSDASAIEHIQGVPVHRLRGKLLPLVFLDRELAVEKKATLSRGAVANALSRSVRFDFEGTRAAHQGWVKRLRRFLDDLEPITEQEAGSHQVCAFGVWLYSRGLQEYQSIPEMVRLEQVHQRFHDLVRQTVHARNSGDKVRANECFGEVMEHSERLLTLLSEVEGCSLQGDATNIVVLQADDRQFGLIVDEINDTEEIVVKPLGKQLKGLSCFAGATIMGDGRVALILDVLGLAQRASVVAEARQQTATDMGDTRSAASASRQSWLLFHTHQGTRLALPLSAVARLEEFPLAKLERSGADEVVQYRGEIMPLLRASHLLNEPDSMSDPLPVVVFNSEGRSMGLMVESIDDITDEAVEVRDHRQRGLVKASAVIQQRVTDIVDLRQVAQAAGALSQPESDGRP